MPRLKTLASDKWWPKTRSPDQSISCILVCSRVRVEWKISHNQQLQARTLIQMDDPKDDQLKCKKIVSETPRRGQQYSVDLHCPRPGPTTGTGRVSMAAKLRPQGNRCWVHRKRNWEPQTSLSSSRPYDRAYRKAPDYNRNQVTNRRHSGGNASVLQSERRLPHPDKPLVRCHTVWLRRKPKPNWCVDIGRLKNKIGHYYNKLIILLEDVNDYIFIFCFFLNIFM